VRYRIPKNELVHEILKSLAEERREFSSLEGLTREVRNRLRRLNRDYVISAERCRRASAEFFSIEASPSSKRYAGKECPVCGGGLNVIKNRTINGSDVPLGYRCGKCGYSSKGYLRVPARYGFVPKI
jgi:hypothetical protein